MNEVDLLYEYTDARKNRDRLKALLEDAQERLNQAESRLIETLQEKGATATAKYDGLGYVALSKPKVYASYRKEDEEQVFNYLRSIGENDIIKDSVHPSSLSSVVARLIEDGREIPDQVNYYLKTGLRLYAEA